MRRLLSLNLVLVMLLGMLPAALAAGDTEDADRHNYEQYIIIDGVEYDATAESLSGEGWKYYNYSFAQGPNLRLMDYSGGAIETNVDLEISSSGENTIASTESYGIYSAGNMTFSSTVYNGAPGRIFVYGGEGYEAVRAEGNIEIWAGSSYLSLVGGNTSAISGASITYKRGWPYILKVGEDAESATEGEYTTQEFFSIEPILYTMTLYGNGGTTEASEEVYTISFTCGTPGYLFLYPYDTLFSTEETTLLTGWNDKADGTGKTYYLDEEYKFEANTYEAEVYALWETDVRKAVILQNFYGESPVSTYYYSGGERVIPVTVGSKYTLPDQSRQRYTFNGWRGEDGELYPAGTVVSIDETMKFTAEFSVMTFTIGGEEYPVDLQSSANKWIYYKDRVQLWIYVGYDCGPIYFPCDVNIFLLSSVIGTDGNPAIYVDGNATVTVHNRDAGDHPIVLTGGDGAPAIECTGTLTLKNSGYYAGENMLVIQGGGYDEPALNAESVYFDECAAYADANCGKEVTKYSNEQYLKLVKKIGPEIIDGSNLTWMLVDGVLTISGSGDMLACEAGMPWSSYQAWISSVVIEAGVTSIPEAAFYSNGVSRLNTVTFEGDAPTFDAEAFSSVTATCYYPAGNTTWTTEVMQNYGGTLTWVKGSYGTCGESLTWMLENGVLTVSGEGKMYDYSYTEHAPWNDYSVNITSVVIEEGVTSVGTYAFNGCTALTSVTLPNTVTNIWFRAFYGCSALESVTIPSAVTFLSSGAFGHCTALKEIVIAEGNPNYKNGNDAVYTRDGSALHIVPAGFEGDFTVPEGTTKIDGYAFWGCRGLTAVEIPTSVTYIGACAFSGCSGLEAVEIPTGVQTISPNTFYACGLNSVTIPSSVVQIGEYAFGKCILLETVHFEGNAPTIKDDAFQNVTATAYYLDSDTTWSADKRQNYGGAIVWETYHTHNYTSAVTAPTCTEQGFTTHSCFCGDNYVDTYVDATGHAIENAVSDGTLYHTCSNCDYCIEGDTIYAEGNQILIFLNSCPSEAQIFVATYSASGQMTGVQLAAVTDNCAEITLDTSIQTDTAEAFFLDGGFTPWMSQCNITLD